MRAHGMALALLCLVSPAFAESDTLDPWFASGRAAVERVRERTPESGPARNVILFVGDGMGISTITAARILEGQQRGETGEENRLSFETLPHVALAKTYTTDQQVGDSAGTITAIASGVKTKARVLGLDDRVEVGNHESADRSRVATILEQAEQRGLSTGIVTTARLTHATPAGLYAHVPNRDWENDAQLSDAARRADFPDIARQFVEFSHGDGIDVALGGGRSNFLPANGHDPEEPALSGLRWDERDLVAEWRAQRPDREFVWNQEQFQQVDPTETNQLLGLFDASHMEFEIDRAADTGGEPSLSEMTAKAIAILSRNPRGFFLLVEGGRIDHGHHAGNAARALTDTLEFAKAVRTAIQNSSPEETLLIVTADHSHVFTISGYPVRGNDILGKVMQPGPAGESPRAARDSLGLPYTTLGYQNGPGYPGASDSQPEGAKRFPHWIGAAQGVSTGRPDLTPIDTRDPAYLQEAAVPLRSETHGGEDVTIYAGGPGSALFDGVQEQHFLYHAMVEALGWNRVPRESP